MSAAPWLHDDSSRDLDPLTFCSLVWEMGRPPPATLADLSSSEDGVCARVYGKYREASSRRGQRAREKTGAKGVLGSVPVPEHLSLVSDETSAETRRKCLEISERCDDAVTATPVIRGRLSCYCSCQNKQEEKQNTLVPPHTHTHPRSSEKFCFPAHLPLGYT